MYCLIRTSQLSEGKPKLLGAMTARAEAQVMRLAYIYDTTPIIEDGRTFLPFRWIAQKAALAVGDFVEHSVAFIFGDSLGDPFADELLKRNWRGRNYTDRYK